MPTINRGAPVAARVGAGSTETRAAAEPGKPVVLDQFDAAGVGRRLEIRMLPEAELSLGSQLLKLETQVTLKNGAGKLTLPGDAAKLTALFKDLRGADAAAFTTATGLDANDFRQLVANLVNSGVTAPVDLTKGALSQSLGLSDGTDGNLGFKLSQWSRVDNLELRKPHQPLSATVTAASANQQGGDGGVGEASAFVKGLAAQIKSGGGDLINSFTKAAGAFQQDFKIGNTVVPQTGTVQISGARTAPTAGPKQTFALLIGNSEYQNAPGARLDGVKTDVPTLAAAMKGKAQVTSLTNQTAAQMKSAIESEIARARPGDDVVIYYSGHGLPSGIVGADGATDPRNGILRASTIEQLIHSAEAKGVNVVVALDACHSGSIGEKVRLQDIVELQRSSRLSPALQQRLDTLHAFVAAKNTALTSGLQDVSDGGKAWKIVEALPPPSTPLTPREFEAALGQVKELLRKPPGSLTGADLATLRAVDHGIDRELNLIRTQT